MAIAANSFAIGSTPVSATPITLGGGGGSIFAPLYDEITLREQVHGECALLEVAAADPSLNELGSSWRSLTAATASLLEIAGGEPLLTERIEGNPTLFEH